MNLDELHQAMETGKVIEYHCMGVEQNADLLLSGPGWYLCRVERIYPSGNVEIALTGEEDGMYVTVLKKNLAIAFREGRAT